MKGGQKYPENVRKFCLKLHYRSPGGYELVREFFNNHLPHQGTIRSWYANSDLNTHPNEINKQCLNILRRKVLEKEIDGEKLIVSLLFDEIYIRKLIQYNHHTRTLQGYSSLHNDKDEETDARNVANQALVFMVNGVNDDFHLPIAYYLISSMDAQKKKEIIESIIEQIIDCGVILSSVSFDGFRPNKKMCELLGAILDIDSPDFKPYFTMKGQRIYIFFDACHMVKLIRNSLAAKGIIFDGDNCAIMWQYFVDLVNMQGHT